VDNVPIIQGWVRKGKGLIRSGYNTWPNSLGMAHYTASLISQHTVHGRKCGESDSYKNSISPQVKIGQTIGVTLDMDKKTLSFDLEGSYLGVAFVGLPPCRLYPAVSAVFGNSEISLVYYGPPFLG
jgi:F-box protein 45